MGSSGSKEASSGARRVRSIGTRVFRPSCFRRPQVSLDDGCREVTGRTKDGHLDKIRKSHQDPNDSRHFSSRDNSDQQEHDMQEHSSTILLDSYSIPDNQASARCASLHLNSCFGLSHNNTKLEPGETASLNSQDDARLVAQAFDSTSENMEEHRAKNISSTEDAAASNADFDGDECPQENHAIASGIERKLSQRRQEPLEDTARFSRTRSVGRLRERVLRRTSFPEGRFGFLLSEESSAYSRQDSRRRLLDALANIPYSDGGDNDRQLVSSTCQASNNFNAANSHNHLTETSELRETGSHDTADHSSTFLERRRRIRSQVRALQRLGSRYENISGHGRQCILSGQHRSGNCLCGTSNHSRNPANQTSSRASISRIVMLAEALFEVLDEIHQQAVVLASRPSSASIASVPAPKEVVDRMPVQNYTKSQKCRGNEDTQCYICLVEYEEGDALRILPCLHEFHQSCVDKWLKEIHRVCPLCRYDVCLSDASHVNGLD